MSEFNWVGCEVHVDCGEIGIFEGKVTEIDNQDGCVRLKNGVYICRIEKVFYLFLVINCGLFIREGIL